MATILLIDDSKFSRALHKAPLVQAGFDVIEAEDGQDGLERVAERQPDCVVLDLLMPVLDGVAFLRHLRVNDGRTPVVVVSADIQTTSRELCEELGISGFLNKPCAPPLLVATVREAIAQSQGAVSCPSR